MTESQTNACYIFITSTRIGGLLPFSNPIFILTKSKFHQTIKQKILQSF